MTVQGEGSRSCYAVLLAGAGTNGVGARALARAHVGWVSRWSAAGYTIPFLYLRSLGLEPDDMFARQSFLGSHDGVLAAPRGRREIDLGVAYASLAPGGRTLVLPERAPSGARVVTAAGPISGDVIFAAAAVDVKTRAALRGAFLAIPSSEEGALRRAMGVECFDVPSLAQFETLLRWRIRALRSEPRR